MIQSIPHRYSRMSFAEVAASSQTTKHRAVFRPLKHGDMTPFTIEEMQMTIKPRHTKRPKPYSGPAWRRYGQDRAIEPLDAGLMRTLRVKG